MTGIQWTEAVWNPTTGCDRVSPGCDHCYALTMAKRLKGMGQAKYQNDGDPRTSGPGFGVTCHPDELARPLGWKRPRKVFVNSMSDLFHPGVPTEFIIEVFDVMANADQHTFQVLTKRPHRMRSVVREYLGAHAKLPNIWLGTSVENQSYAKIRVPELLATQAAVSFLSIEPLLGPVDLQAPGVLGWRGAAGVLHPEYEARIQHENLGRSLDWVIIGGESGPGARPMEREWAESIVAQCMAAGVAVFVKQLGTVLGGKRHADMETFPESLRVREYPA